MSLRRRAPAGADHRFGGSGGGNQPTSIATASTTYTVPFNIARQFASIDHISNGRAARNIVTSWLATAAENYGGAGRSYPMCAVARSSWRW